MTGPASGPTGATGATGPTGDAYERDPGLAAERTELAWGRSALSLFACGAVLLRGAENVTGHETQPVVGLVVLLLGGVVWSAGVPLARQRARASVTGARRPAQLHELLPIAVGTSLVGVAALLIDLLFTG
ncbi:unannotated protein [freshwater metagenome]|uniref:Unannotated protein n=1 Tax=freshwater metagenome TaxID=449393 RepID=A0A6J6GTB0_9ZZZZ